MLIDQSTQKCGRYTNNIEGENTEEYDGAERQRRMTRRRFAGSVGSIFQVRIDHRLVPRPSESPTQDTLSGRSLR